MKKTVLIAMTCIAVMQAAVAQQSQISEGGCATITTQEEIQRVYDFVQNPVSYKTTSQIDTIPLSIHIVGNDNGTGYYKLDNLFDVICQLNEHYIPVNFYFYIKGEIEYIDNSAYFNHNYQDGYQMMNSHNVANTVNVYFVGDPNGACGYYSYGPDAVAIKNTCANSNSTTLVHELGHYFGLPHTFYGWENGNVPANPEKVTRGAGANCNTAGDGFCDTEADYQSARWNCPYVGVQVDQDNVPYHPDSSLYMGYALDACMSRFSDQQIGEMQYNLYQFRQYLNQPHAAYTALDTPKAIYPTDTLFSNYKMLKWHAVPGAEYYQVKIMPATTSVVLQTVLTTDTVLALTPNFSNGQGYRAKISPMTGMNVCRQKTGTFPFIYTSATTTLGVSNPELEHVEMTVYPNPATSSFVTVYLGQLPVADYTLELMSISGQKLQTIVLNNSRGSVEVSINTSNLPAGMYFISLQGASVRQTQKLLIQN